MMTSTLTRAVFRETSRSDPMHLRPYSTTKYDTGVAMAFSEATESGKIFSAEALAPIATGFLNYSADPVGVANITHGFDTKRFSFVMTFEEYNGNTGGRTVHTLTGYTSHMGATQNQVDINQIHLDPEMHLYFNNLITLRERTINGPLGPQIQTNVVSARQILHNVDSTNYLAGVQQQFTLRPEDIMTHLTLISDHTVSSLAGQGVMDASAMLTAARPSSRSILLPANYLSKTLTNYVSAEHTTLADPEGDMHDVYQSAKTRLREAPLSSSALMKVFMTSTNFNDLGFITVRELMSIYPSLDPVSEVHYNDLRARDMEYQPGMHETFATVKSETITANILSQTIPALMTDCVLSNISIYATNDVLGGQFDVRLSGAFSYAHNVDLTPWLVTFKQRLITEVLMPASHFGQVSLIVNAQFAVDGDTYITVSYDGGPATPYYLPQYCDNLFSGVLSTSGDSVTMIAQDMEMMLQNIGGDLDRLAYERQQHQPGMTSIPNFVL